MKIIFSVCCFSFSISVCMAQEKTAIKAASNPTEWKLVWHDEFDKDGLPDPTQWDYEEGFVRNEELQYYTVGKKDNARVENGCLVIEAKKRPITTKLINRVQPIGGKRPILRHTHPPALSPKTKKILCTAEWKCVPKYLLH